MEDSARGLLVEFQVHETGGHLIIAEDESPGVTV